MTDPGQSVELWIEDPPLLQLRRNRHPRMLHHYRTCTDPPGTIAVMGVVRDSECSGSYAVEGAPPWIVLGEVCERCRRRYLAEHGADPTGPAGSLFTPRA